MARVNMALRKATRITIAVVAVVVVAVAAYSLFPYVATTRISNLSNDQSAYIYGSVQDRASIGNLSAFKLTDSSGSILVLWNGSLPAIGSKVLVHGTMKETGFLNINVSIFEAGTVINWPI